MNAVLICNPKPQSEKTVYPVTVSDENGNKKLLHVAMSDDEIQELSVDDFKLSALLRAGIDPNTMRVNTSSFNSVNDIQNFDRSVQDFIAANPVENDETN